MMLLKNGFRYLIRRPLQSILCILGVALGVAVVVAIDLANGSASRAFTLSTETVAGRATHQVVGGATGLDEDAYRRIRIDAGVQQAAPVVEGYATAVELDQQPLRILGVDIFAEAPFRSYLGGEAVPDLPALAQFLAAPDAILIGEAVAQRYGLEVGDSVIEPSFELGQLAGQDDRSAQLALCVGHRERQPVHLPSPPQDEAIAAFLILAPRQGVGGRSMKKHSSSMVSGSREIHGPCRDIERSIALADDMEMGHRKNEHGVAVPADHSDDPRRPLFGPEFQGGIAVVNGGRLAHESGLRDEQGDDDDNCVSHSNTL